MAGQKRMRGANMSRDIFKERTSIRHYTKENVGDEAIRQLLEAAINAPSAGNLQPWHFYVVRNAELKARLSECSFSQGHIQSAPVAILVCAEPLRSASRYGKRGSKLYALQDTAAATENMLLCAAMLGLGACWCGAFDEGLVSQVMELPGERRPVGIVSLGYPARVGKKPKRRPLEEVVTTYY